MKINRRKKLLAGVLIMFLCVGVGKIIFRAPFVERDCQMTGKDCRVYYLLNLDGMKGLGHSALLLVDEEGRGRVFSYNGMQYDLFRCLTGKEGIGKMMEYALTSREVDTLLETGNLTAGDYEECDNFDRALYRCLSREQYERIVKEAEFYQEVGDTYERLYAACDGAKDRMRTQAEEDMEAFLQKELPHYQIYTHNCDTVARELLALADEEIRAYNASHTRLTPGGNYYAMCSRLSGIWGIARLGRDSQAEKLLSFFIR